MRVLVAMSGGVDSSVAAALLAAEGHDVVGVTLRLWDNPGTDGCCSAAEIDDARRVADQLGLAHFTWSLTEDFERAVVGPYVAAHAGGRTPNPCIACNRHLKFGRFLARARQLGFDAVATGHHARVGDDPGTGRRVLRRARDLAKDQSYVLHVLGQRELARCRFPVGELTKDEVRARARALGLRTAEKPDSQDACFVTTAGGRSGLLGRRIPLHPATVVDEGGRAVGRVEAVELVTVGQRKGLGLGGGGSRRYALSADPVARRVVVGPLGSLLVDGLELEDLAWVDGAPPPDGPVLAQGSAHGPAVAAHLEGATVTFARPQRRVAPGQSVVLYASEAGAGDERGGERVVGGGVVAGP